MKDFVEVNETKCTEVNNCMCVKENNGKQYCRGCGNIQPNKEKKRCKNIKNLLTSCCVIDILNV